MQQIKNDSYDDRERLIRKNYLTMIQFYQH